MYIGKNEALSAEGVTIKLLAIGEPCETAFRFRSHGHDLPPHSLTLSVLKRMVQHVHQNYVAYLAKTQKAHTTL